MEWEKLLSKQMLCEKETDTLSPEDGRSPFQRDFDRIVFSSAFRRLQDKTQIFPLPESDFVHTRLTHSLEVSCAGRSLGTLVGSKMLNRYPLLPHIQQASSIVPGLDLTRLLTQIIPGFFSTSLSRFRKFSFVDSYLENNLLILIDIRTT